MNDLRNKKNSEYTDHVIQIKRVSKKTKGGNQISFTALVVSGNKKGKIGLALGKAKSVSDAIQKAIKRAQKTTIIIKLIDGTIPNSIKLKFKSALIMLRPGKKGSGLIAGGSVRMIGEVAGITDMVSKIIGSKNKSVNAWATFKALSTFKI